MADAELLSGDGRQLTKEVLLADLLGHDFIDLHKYRDAGPPPGTPVKEGEAQIWLGDVWPGWVVVTSADLSKEHWRVSFASEGSWCRAAVIGNAVSIAEADASSPAYQSDPRTARQRRLADGLAGQVAWQALGADMYVTDREYLHLATWGVADGVAVCSVDDALALLGLYFRAQGAFMIANRFGLNEGLFYWVGMRELLPEGWRWFAACVQSDGGSGSRDLTALGQSALERVARALKARDQVLVALNQPQHNDTRRQTIAGLDEMLVNLMGAVDVAARVVHIALNLPETQIYNAGWQEQRWLELVRAADPSLPPLLDPGTATAHTLTILRKLRNSVHGEALQMVAFRDSRARDDESRVVVPPEDETEVLSAMDALGGSDRWGVRRFGGRDALIDPGLFLERLFPMVLVLLNELMRATPVERLPHVALLPQHFLPPAANAGSLDLWDIQTRSSIRWQLGL